MQLIYIKQRGPRQTQLGPAGPPDALRRARIAQPCESQPPAAAQTGLLASQKRDARTLGPATRSQAIWAAPRHAGARATAEAWASSFFAEPSSVARRLACTKEQRDREEFGFARALRMERVRAQREGAGAAARSCPVSGQDTSSTPSRARRSLPPQPFRFTFLFNV